jgi:hypothetical protein
MIKIAKGIALLNFIVLITLFLIYRCGLFDTFFYNALTSPNGGTPAKVVKDAPTQNQDSTHNQRLSSSKSMIITDVLDLKNAAKNVNKDSSDNISTTEERLIFSSSKSGIIIDPHNMKNDSIKNNKNTKRNKK